MNNKSVHFIGIGGSGQSNIASIAKSYGFSVSGCDISDKNNLVKLEQKGIKIFREHSPTHIKNVDIVACTSAVISKKDNEEVLACKGKLIIGEDFLSNYILKDKFLICIAGTHGKGTTTSFVSLILEKAGWDPTCLIGSELINWNNESFRLGKSKYFVLETDEYKDKFLLYRPNIAVITSIELDHTDYFKNFNQLLESFKNFVLQMQDPKILILNEEDSGCLRLKKLLESWNGEILLYKNILNATTLAIPGLHIKQDASAAMKLAQALNIKEDVALKAVKSFKGNKRRFEYKGKFNNAPVYEDYAHHPSAIKLNINAAKELYPNKKIVVVFQPHTYSRLNSFFDDFCASLRDADKVIVTDVFNARGEVPTEVNSSKLAHRLASKGNYISGDFEKIKAYLAKEVTKENVLLILGAGDIFKLTESLV